MKRMSLFVLAAVSLSSWAAVAQAEGDFLGWQDMRVIRLSGSGNHAVVCDLDRDGRDEVLMVDTAQSRLLIYRWLPKDQRKPVAPPDPESPNDLPMAPEFEREEIDFEELPYEVLPADLDGDGKLELITLSGPPLKVIVYEENPKPKKDESKWRERSSWDLKEGSLAGVRHNMLLRHLGKKEFELLIAFDDGIQQLSLKKDAKPEWKSPREETPRSAWWLLDLDGDDDEDLVEYVGRAGETVRWHENVNGRLSPSRPVSDEVVVDAGVLRSNGKQGQVVLLHRIPRGSLRTYGMGQGEASEVGKQQVLPLNEAKAYCGIKLGKEKAVAFVDAKQPRLIVHVMGKNGWGEAESYPIVSNVNDIASPAAEPGTLLLWSKDATDLHISKWEKGRLTYPTLWEQSADVADRQIIAMQTVGGTVWWAQKVGSDLDLYVWEPDAKEPSKTRFPGAGGNVDKVTWLGGNRLLTMEKYARAATLVTLENGELKKSEPSHLKKAALEEFVLIGEGEDRRLGRTIDGVLQWLGEDLQPTDQVMLPDGARLGSFVPTEDGQAWAMEQGGGKMHLLKPDKAGILRVDETVKVDGNWSALMREPVLGLILVGGSKLATVSPGKPQELRLRESLETQTERQTRLDEMGVGRFFTTDVTGDGHDDILLVDDEKHHLMLVRRTSDGLEKGMSWQVFESSSYPYGGSDYDYMGRGRQVQEPHLVMGLDMDGDEAQDLVLLCHDRMIIYLARKEKP